MKIKLLVIIMMVAVLGSCNNDKRVMYDSPDDYPVRMGSLSEMEYAPSGTNFHLWSPNADEVRLMLYDEAEGGH